MFIAIYEFTVKPGMEKAFEEAWFEVTKGIYQSYGSLGSRLHRDAQQDDVWVGYAQWPTREAWDSEKEALPESFQLARKQMLECLVESKTVYQLEVTRDYLQSKAVDH